ncbi:hypothetical protein GWN42_31240 [candidate division KSB1 bacterium]|nr:hypothetical protein [Phycisphaerae bacterium]NIQ92534.1 hypothetical protein [Deltaproteobacteria bacterium]NIV97144.1 hypothetical protein [candidate division KSB1 bacterium]
MKEINLNKEEAEAFLFMKMLANLSQKCIAAENHPIMKMDAFHVHVKTMCPSRSRGVVIPFKPRLMAEVVAEEMTGWVGAIKCDDFRNWLKKAFNDTPESLVDAMSAAKAEDFE